jgi:hypothetical protein
VTLKFWEEFMKLIAIIDKNNNFDLHGRIKKPVVAGF